MVEPDEVDAYGHQTAWPSPMLGQGPNHERPQPRVGGYAARATEAGNEKTFCFVRLFDLQRPSRDVQGRCWLALCRQRRCEIVERHDEIRPDLERPTIACDGFVEHT